MAGNRRGKLVSALPARGDLAGLRALLVDTEAIVLEELHRHRPDFRRRTLRHHPTAVAAFLQAEITGTGGYSQGLWTRYFKLALDIVVGHVAGDRQQRHKALVSLDTRRQLHRGGLTRLQVIAAAVAEVTLLTPQPTATAGAGNNHG